MCAAGQQQAPAPAPTPEDFGFGYHVPSGWDAIDAQATLPEVKAQQTAHAKTDEERKEIACIQVPVSARKGAPPSLMASMAPKAVLSLTANTAVGGSASASNCCIWK